MSHSYCIEQETDLLVEEEFLDVLVSLARRLPVEDLWQAEPAPEHTPLQHQDQSRRALQVDYLARLYFQWHACIFPVFPSARNRRGFE